jgi:transcriptional regulator with XRE-family HTH domain
MKLGKILRMARQKKKLTTKQLSDSLDKHVSISYISQIEVHEEIPSPELLKKLSRALGLEYEAMSLYAKEAKLKQFKKILDRKYRHDLDFQ